MTEAENNSPLTPAELNQLRAAIRKNPRTLNRVRETISNEEYLRRHERDRRRDQEILKEQGKKQVEKALRDWRTQVGATFADANTDYPQIKDRVNRLVTKTGTHKTSLIFFGRQSGSGKAQPVTEIVSTPTGFRPIGSIEAGDQVHGSNGKAITVTAVYPQGMRPIYNVRFADNVSVRADVDHLWEVLVDGETQIVTTETLEELLAAGTTVLAPLPAPVVGAHHHSERLSENIQPHVNERWSADMVFSASPEHRRLALKELLAEYSVPVAEGSEHVREVNSERYAEIAVLARSLGGTVTVTETPDVYKFNLPFQLNSNGGNPDYVPYRELAEVAYSGYEEAVCIQVDADDHLYLTRDWIVTHNTWGAYSYLNQAIQAGAVSPGQIVRAREGGLLKKIASSGYKQPEMMEELLAPRNKIFFIDDVGVSSFSSDQVRTSLWYELIDHIYAHQLTIIITTMKEPTQEHLGRWLGEQAFDRLYSLIGGREGVIVPTPVNRRSGVFQEQENRYRV